ncbi:MAG: hypothetical protein JXQ83_09245 [Candidatus Glassbacteria bacterium]|nr:hypothetical protein [Candidatus Glassbacteria bacterium]
MAALPGAHLLYPLVWALAAWGTAPYVEAAAPGFRLVASGMSGIEVDFELPGWDVEALEVGGRAFTVIRADGASELERGGFPVLPEYKAVLAVPPSAAAEVSWQAVSQRTLSVPLPLPAQPAPGSDGEGPAKPEAAVSFSEEFSSAAAYPAQLILTRGPERLRDLMVLEIVVRPFTCLPATGRLQVTEKIRINVTLRQEAGSPGTPARAAGSSGGAFEAVYRDALLNYQSSKAWRLPAAGRGALLSSSPFARGDRWVSLHIGGTDMYAVTPERLSQAGVAVEAVDPATFRLFTGGGRMLDEGISAPEPDLAEVALRVSGSDDGSFDSGDRLIFYGQGTDRFTVDDTGGISSLRHRYDSLAVYWLTWGDPGAHGLQMSEHGSPPPAGAAPLTAAETWYHFEENTEYLTIEDPYTYIIYNPAPDYWVWRLEADRDGTAERPFDLAVTPEPAGSFFRCEFYGNVARRFIDYTFAVNGFEAGSGTNYFYKTVTSPWLPLPEGLLSRQANSFTLRGEEQVPGFFELRVNTALSLGAGERLVFHRVDPPGQLSFEVSAPVAGADFYEVTDPLHPEWITGAEQAGQGRLRFGTRSSSSPVRSFAAVAADSYAVPKLVRAERPAGLRSLSGIEYLIVAPKELITQAAKLAALRSAEYRSGTIAVEDIYNEFSSGQADPVALRNFLKYAFENWAIVPEFVLFFGDGHNDFRGYTSVGRSKPNYILPFIDANDLALEEWFVRVTASALPQMAVGRIPVQSESQAAVVVDKILKYEQATDPGDWVRRVVLVADDGFVLGNNCDAVVNPDHTGASEQLDSLLPADIERKKVYLQQYPFDPPGIGTRKPAAAAELASWWRQGALIVNYIGHGSALTWSQERVFDVERDLPMISNGYRLPLVLNASCSIGHFDDYSKEAMAERVITVQGGGAVAAYAATRITYSGRNLELSKFFVESLFADGGSPVGAAALAARTAVGGFWDIGNAQRYSIFGDPAMRLHVPGRGLRFELEGTSNIRVGDKVKFSGTVVDGSGVRDENFSGVAQVKFLGGGRPLEISYECRQSGALRERSVVFNRQPAALFDGPVTVAGGRFSGAFILPLNLAGSLPYDTLNLETGLFIGYATSETADGSGVSASLAVSRQSGAIADTSAPEIGLFCQGQELADGDRVSITEPLLLVLSDESGINTTGAPGVQLSLEVDQGTTYAADLTSLFRYRQDSYQEGAVPVDLSRAGAGLHSLRFRASDNLLNSASAEWMLQLAGAAGGLTLDGVMNYPNPFRDETDICFEVSAPADVLVRIFTVAGRPVRELRSYGVPAGFNTVRWDGTDEYRQKIANGVYLYKVICKSSINSSPNSAEEVEAIGKALLSR